MFDHKYIWRADYNVTRLIRTVNNYNILFTAFHIW